MLIKIGELQQKAYNDNRYCADKDMKCELGILRGSALREIERPSKHVNHITPEIDDHGGYGSNIGHNADHWFCQSA